MTELVSVPLKKTSDLDLVKPLKTLISSTYSTADQVTQKAWEKVFIS